MKKMFFLMLIVVLTAGCSTQDYVIKIPRTPENLAAYRQCEHTVAVATGYDNEGYKDLKRRCLATLDGLTEERAGNSDELQKIWPRNGCTKIETLVYGYDEIFYHYFLCDTAKKNSN